MAATLAAKYEREEREYQEWERQQALKDKFESTIKVKIDAIKTQAQDEFKKGSYSEAIALYKQAEEMLEIARDDFQESHEKELAQIEATIFGNLAFCYQKEQHD